MIFFILAFSCMNLCLGFALGMICGYGPAPPVAFERLFPRSEKTASDDEPTDDDDDEDDLGFFSSEEEKSESA